MSISYDQKTWYNGEEGGTPITASELNRMEQGIADAVEAINEGGGGQGGGAHTNLDNIANTTTNNVRQLNINFMNEDDVKLNYCYGRDSYVCVREGKTYRSSDTVNWQEDNNNLSFGGDVQSISVAFAFRGASNEGYVALIRLSYARVFIYRSDDALTWYRCNDLPNTETDYHDNGYSNDDSSGCSKFLEVDNKLFLYTGIKYSDNESMAQCIYTTNKSDWSVGTLTNGYDTVGAESDGMQTDGNYVYFSKINSDSEHGWIDLWRASDGLAFSKYAEISSNNFIYSIGSQIFYHNQRYYIQFHKGIATSNSLTTMVEQTVGFANDTVVLLGFVDDTMLLQAFDYDDATGTYTSCFVYLAPDSNGDYPITATKSEIENLDGCGFIGELDGRFHWRSNANICFTNMQANIDVKSAYSEGDTSSYNNFIKVYNATPFVNEVSLAANILGLGSGSSGGGSGTSDYPDLTNKPRINGVELLGNKLVGLLSTDIQINAEKIGYSGTVSGASTAKAAIESLKSSIDNISVDADDVSYDNTTSGLSATNVQGAIDEVNSEKGNASISVLPNTYNGVFRITNESTSSNHDVYAKSYVKDMLDPCLQTPINNLQPNIVAVSTLITLKTDSSADYGQTVQLQCQFGQYIGAFDNSGNATFNVGYVGVYKIYIANTYRRSIYINSTGGCFHFPLSSTMTNVDIRTRDAKIIGQQLGIFDTSDNMIAKFKLTKDDYSIALPNPSSTYIVKMYVDVDQSISQATTNVSDQFVPNTADVVLCTHPASGNDFDPIVRISTTDLTPGSSDLANGTIYLVYE